MILAENVTCIGERERKKSKQNFDWTTRKKKGRSEDVGIHRNIILG
jgi:hypothetical protein